MVKIKQTNYFPFIYMILGLALMVGAFVDIIGVFPVMQILTDWWYQLMIKSLSFSKYVLFVGGILLIVLSSIYIWFDRKK